MKDEGILVYPSDEPGEEMSEVSRVWRIYVDEATKFDASWTEGCNRGIDVLLVFVSSSLCSLSLRNNFYFRPVCFPPS